MWDEVENLGSRGIISSFTKSHTMRENGTEGKGGQGRKNLNNSKVRGLSPREIL